MAAVTFSCPDIKIEPLKIHISASDDSDAEDDTDDEGNVTDDVNPGQGYCQKDEVGLQYDKKSENTWADTNILTQQTSSTQTQPYYLHPPTVGVIPEGLEEGITMTPPQQYGGLVAADGTIDPQYEYVQMEELDQYPHFVPEQNHDIQSVFDPSNMLPVKFEANTNPDMFYMDSNPWYYSQESEEIEYPAVYISPAGLLTVLMRNNVAVEMTLDQTIRVVNHQQKTVAATSSRGNSSCLYHRAVKICQDGTRTEVDLFEDRKAIFTSDDVVFSSGPLCYRMAPPHLYVTEPRFTDLARDSSVSLLYSSRGYGPTLIPQYVEVAESAKYNFHRNGGITVFINGMRIYQSPIDDVMVSCGPKYIRVCPRSCAIVVRTHFVELAVEESWNVRMRRGGHVLFASHNDFCMSTGEWECGFDETRHVYMKPLDFQHTPLHPNKYVDDLHYQQTLRGPREVREPGVAGRRSGRHRTQGWREEEEREQGEEREEGEKEGEQEEGEEEEEEKAEGEEDGIGDKAAGQNTGRVNAEGDKDAPAVPKVDKFKDRVISRRKYSHVESGNDKQG